MSQIKYKLFINIKIKLKYRQKRNLLFTKIENYGQCQVMSIKVFKYF